MSSSGPRRAFDVRVVALTAAALVAMALGAVAGWQIPSDDDQPENRAVPTAAPSDSSPGPEQEQQAEPSELTPESPDEGLTEVSPSPEPTTGSPEPEPEPSDDQATEPPAEPSSPEAGAGAGAGEEPGPGPTGGPSPTASTPEELRAWCEASEPYDYFGSPEFREMCEEEFGE